MILGLVLFLGIHTLTTQRDQRAELIGRLGGEGTYKGIYGLVSLVGLGLIVWGFARYHSAEFREIWTPPTFLKHLNIALYSPVGTGDHKWRTPLAPPALSPSATSRPVSRGALVPANSMAAIWPIP